MDAPDPLGSGYDCQREAAIQQVSTMAELPRSQTLDELVAFWDTHDFTDYMDEKEEADLETGLPGRRQESLRIRLDKSLMQRLREIATERGLSSGGLARLWLEERLLQESECPPKAKSP